MNRIVSLPYPVDIWRICFLPIWRIITFLIVLIWMRFWIFRLYHRIQQLRLKNAHLADHRAWLENGIEEMQSAISHDLSAPLPAICGFCESMQKQLSDSGRWRRGGHYPSDITETWRDNINRVRDRGGNTGDLSN